MSFATLQEATKARGEPMTDADYAIDKALATGLLDSNGNLNFHMRETREEIIAGILTTAKAWGRLMTCAEAERLRPGYSGDTDAAGDLLAYDGDRCGGWRHGWHCHQSELVELDENLCRAHSSRCERRPAFCNP